MIAILDVISEEVHPPDGTVRPVTPVRQRVAHRDDGDRPAGHQLLADPGECGSFRTEVLVVLGDRPLEPEVVDGEVQRRIIGPVPPPADPESAEPGGSIAPPGTQGPGLRPG